MQKTWEQRITDARDEKSSTESTEFGVKLEMLVNDFFVSDDAIPQRCKIYTDGRLSYRLQGENLSDLIINEIFRKKFHLNNQAGLTIKMHDIPTRMQALWLVLDYDHTTLNGTARTIYGYALLASMAALFTALLDHPLFMGMLNDRFTKTFRNLAYHFHYAFQSRNGTLNISSLKALATHCYEHCRSEFSTIYAFSILSTPAGSAERYTTEFKNQILLILNKHSVFYEHNETVKKHLAEDLQQLNELIAYINANPNLFHTGQNPQQTWQAICGNANGLLVANISANAMSLLKKRTYSTTAITTNERKAIQAQYGSFIQIGSAFRHNKTSHTVVLDSFGIQPLALAPRILTKRQNQPTAIQPLKLSVSHYRLLWGILANGSLACTDDAETLRLVPISGGKSQQLISLNPATPTWNYFHYANINLPMILIDNKILVIGMFQYLHIIDIDLEHGEPEIITLLQDGGVTAILEISNSLFAIGSGSGHVTLHDAKTGEVKQKFISSKTTAISAMIKTSHNRLAIGYIDGTICLWNYSTNKHEATLHVSNDLEDILNHMQPNKKAPEPMIITGGRPFGGVFSLELSLNGHLYVGYGNNNICLWDLKSQKILKTYVGHTGWPTSMKALSNGELLSTGPDKTLRFWGTSNCKRTVELEHSGEAISLVRDQVVVANNKSATTIQLTELKMRD
ncbi:MAG: hypothetical protein M3R00_00835 [Pseudomonadota bacterium]|nr:hypothetical protein [Pseudomonadota bacterium]